MEKAGLNENSKSKFSEWDSNGGSLCYLWPSMSNRCLAGLAFGFLAVCGQAAVVINEIHYDPDVKTELVEFIELHNTGPAAADLSGWSLTDAVDFTFPAGASIPPDGYIVVSQNPTRFNSKFRVASLGPWVGSLRNEGEEIILRDRLGATVDRVDYQLGFPWPTVGEPPGFSIELANPAFDNDLGGNWRASGTAAAANSVTLIPRSSTWKYFKGTREPSNPLGQWRTLDFPEDASWVTGTMPIGYDPSVAMNTPLPDMRGGYSTVYFRKAFTVSDPAQFTSLQLQAMFDDGFKVWINGRLVLNPNMPGSEHPFNGLASGSARESSDYVTFNLPPPAEYIVQGQNIISIQAANVLLADSSDFFLDAALIGRTGSSGVAPSPMARNNSFTSNLPPALRQVNHAPNQPRAGVPVAITAKVTDPEGVAAVSVLFQTVDPGNYIERTDAAYATNWTEIAMRDDGSGGDEYANDSIFTALLPGSIQAHRRLVRYRISASDTTGKTVVAPYAEDPVPNFAYFVYDGVPAWSGAIQPGSTDPARGAPALYPESVMRSLPVYHLISKKTSVEASTWIERYTGDEYKWSGTLVYDGKVYDHIHYRARGGVWRYAMGKNMWKMDFNRGHDFRPKDNWGREYRVGWTKLNLGASIQQGDYGHRGEQGMFESVGFRLFNLAGVEAPKSHFVHFRIVDEPEESGASQYLGDFWGLYLAIEQEDSRFLDEHGLPDSNFYKMENGFGTLNNQGPTGATDGSDLSSFLTAIRTTQPEPWWRSNFDLNKYYSYRTIVEGIHHYDIDGDPGKNYFYYTNDLSGKWEVHAWDLDLTWADGMYGSGNEQFKSRVLPISNLGREYRNRARELRDLLFNTDQAHKLIDEYAAMISAHAGGAFVAADRAMWDYNPVMRSAYVNLSKSGHGRFYQATPARSFAGMVQIMKNYVVSRGSLLDSQATEQGRPSRPTINNTSPATNPANRLSFESSAFSGASAFAAMQWRLGEITPASAPVYDPNNPRAYEIEPVWQSPELSPFSSRIEVPPGVVRVGKTYRARVKFKDVVGRWSNWSPPAEFVAGEPDNAAALVENLRVTELMFNPVAGSDLEFVELFNSNESFTLDLSGAKFTSGIDFTFPPGSYLLPGAHCLVVRASAADSFAAFRAHHGIQGSVPVFGPYAGALSNDGEEVTIKTASSGAVIASFSYGDSGLWPVEADGAGHSLVPRYLHLRQSDSDFSYPGNWRASAFIKGSPGIADPLPARSLAINEVMANTRFGDPAFPGYDSNDWIELVNPTAGAIEWQTLFLSDDRANLKKWALPAGSLGAGARVVFDEITGFHSPLPSGFGLNQGGEEVFLSHLPGDSRDRVLDAVKFKGQTESASWSRLPDGNGFWRASAATRGVPNGPPSPSVVISEIMYHPATNATETVDNISDEYVEVHNPTSASVALFGGSGTFRIDGGIAFQFPAGLALPAGESLLLVNFNPTNSAMSNAFAAKFNVPAGTRTLGPFAGKLSNASDRVAIERPEAPNTAGDPFSWFIIDEVTYGLRPQWPVGPNGGGSALHRVSFAGPGNDPANWAEGPADPGRIVGAADDRDADGMPDLWELANQLNPDFAGDAFEDPDGDGLTNLAEFQSGSDPRNAASNLRIAAAEIQAGQFSVHIYAVAGKRYLLERCENANTLTWEPVREYQPANSGWIDLNDPSGIASGGRFFRVRLLP